MRPALVILGKDLRQRLRDRSALLVAIVVPLVLASIFGLIFHNAIGGRVSFKFGLVDQDHGPAAQAFKSAALVAARAPRADHRQARADARRR